METNQLKPVGNKNTGGVGGLVGTNPFRDTLQGFALWLEAQGYAQSTVYGMPRQVAEFLRSLEAKGIAQTSGVTQKEATAFMESFQQRKNQRRGGGISAAHVAKQRSALTRFGQYLHRTGQGVPLTGLPCPPPEGSAVKTVLNRREVAQLYAACGDGPLGSRDRAMLALFYGCGLRKSEGLARYPL